MPETGQPSAVHRPISPGFKASVEVHSMADLRSHMYDSNYSEAEVWQHFENSNVYAKQRIGELKVNDHDYDACLALVKNNIKTGNFGVNDIEATSALFPALGIASTMFANLDKKVSRRTFLKAGAATALGAVLAKITGTASASNVVKNEQPTKEQLNETTALAAQGMAFSLLKQVRAINPGIANLIVDAFNHTSEMTLKEKKYDLAQQIFERMSDSMLKWGSVQALNRQLEKTGETISWKDIRKGIDAVINAKDELGRPLGQPLGMFDELYNSDSYPKISDPKKLEEGFVYMPKKYVWRVIASDEWANVRKEAAIKYNHGEGVVGTMLSPEGREDAGGEFIMARMYYPDFNYDSEKVWYATDRGDNAKGIDWGTTFFPPDIVYVNGSAAKSTSP